MSPRCCLLRPILNPGSGCRPSGLGGDLTQNGIGSFPVPFFLACFPLLVFLARFPLLIFLLFPLDVVHLHIL
jgi:hypothetical protein